MTGEAAAKLADDGAYQARLEDTERAIAAGDFGLVGLQKANGEGGWLRGTEDFQRLYGLIAKRAADTLDYERAVDKFTDPNYHFNPDSREDQRAVDLIYERGIGWLLEFMIRLYDERGMLERKRLREEKKRD